MAETPVDVPGVAAMRADGAAGSRVVADIGGSNARFGWLAPGATGVEFVETLPVANFPDLAGAARHYLAGIAAREGAAHRPPAAAALAVATAVIGDQVDFTNSPWSFSQAALRAALGLQRLAVINDFEALALALPRLQPHQLRADGPLPTAQGMLAVVGPGTGLGVAGIVQTRRGWQALPGEGGHATLAARDDFEAEVLKAARRQFEHVSAERLLSGIGLPTLHAAVAEALGAASPALEAPQILQAGLAGDTVARRTLETFCALLGSFCGNVALTLGARGGVFIGGGIVPRIADLFFASDFRRRFEAKGRFESYLKTVPTALITDTLVALDGAAAALDDPPA